MTRDKRLAQIIPKIERGKSHIRDLETQVRTFIQNDPYEIQTKRNPDTRQLIYYIASARPTPVNLSLVAGDAIQNLVSALDHLAYQIVGSDTNDNPPRPNRIYFPVSDDAATYETTKRGKLQGALDESFLVIDSFKPYKGGTDLLWALQRLNNIEKHRLLITVGSMYRSLNLGAHLIDLMQKSIDGDPQSPFHGRTIPPIDAFFGVADVDFPLKVGYELFVDGPDAEPNEKLQFRFDVALHEPEIGQPRSLLDLLHAFTALVEEIVSALKSRL